ncbi:short-chain dehydrogenase/reductase [Legionella birminghamensis]|uniref:Short-chain dehydrogenase/reductase n=1 Tax=Legionella birminghamensis TaxID=28083 RepID=A0A378IBT3_9GAMM|nr:SDR family oxidoreductase [Legionella birminghamensis]KTC75452.1 short-chain dehydrogenase/reductase [Legionella birminghamensis]STX32677.1 short-chain dehydrogenase/reductase [Legionella birminghamensis]
MDFQMDGKVALVTGSTGGIGLAIAEVLAAEGASVIINGRSLQRVHQAMDHIRSLHPAAKLVAGPADLSTKEGVNSLIQAMPSVDILINNVGIYEIKSFMDISDEEWFHLFDVNVMSGVRLSRHYLPLMLQKNEGRIIFISSESGLQIPPEMIHYGMTKTAQLAIARGMAELTAGTNVTVNSVLPGPTQSEGVNDFIKKIGQERSLTAQQIEQEFFNTMRPSSLLKRFASTKEVAYMVAFLCSPLASATNGSSVHVDGGIVRSIA